MFWNNTNGKQNVCTKNKSDMSIKRETDDVVVVPGSVEQFFAAYVAPPPRILDFSIRIKHIK